MLKDHGRHAILTAFLLLQLIAVSAHAVVPENPTLSEYEVKGAYVYSFAKFIEWPAETLQPKTPIVIGVIGDNQFAALLKTIVKDKTIQEHPISVQIIKWPATMHSCHIIFVAASERKRFHEIASALQNQPVLTVTEYEEGSQNKGIFNLFLEGEKVQFEADVAAAEKARLQISSKLLRLAKGFNNRQPKGK
jgi:hypothetical protein